MTEGGNPMRWATNIIHSENFQKIFIKNYDLLLANIKYYSYLYCLKQWTEGYYILSQKIVATYIGAVGGKED